MSRHPTPEHPGHYWAKLKLADDPDDNSPNWEVVQVNDNIMRPWCEADIETGECMSVAVPGLEKSQWLDDFVWGPPVEMPAAILAALPSYGGGEKGDSSSRDHDHTAGIALEGSWPVAEYVEELANVLWQMARGDFSRSWSTNFRNEIRSAPNIITIAGNQLAKLAAVARSSAKQIVGESSRDEHSSSPSGEVERLTTRLDAVEKALGEAVSVASLLYQNSELCARNHHWTTGGFTMPGWLADASETIERARSALPQGEGK